MTPQLPHFLVLACALFVFGIFTATTRRNAVGVLMGVELILNAANINLVAFHHFNPSKFLTGQIFALFVIVLAAAEAAVALAIVLALYMTQKNIDVSDATTLKE